MSSALLSICGAADDRGKIRLIDLPSYFGLQVGRRTHMLLILQDGRWMSMYIMPLQYI